MSESQEHIVDWLRDAHAMEQQAEQLFKGELNRLENYPELKRRYDEQLTKCLSQQKALEECIKRLGGSTSVIKDVGAKIIAFGQTVSGVFVGDEVVKSAMSIYVFTNMEIASYRILIAAADYLGDQQTKAACEAIIKEESEFAVWLLEYMPELTRSFLSRSDTEGVSAKR